MAPSTPHEERPLESGISIQLQEPNRGYRPGQTIHGRVVCQNPGHTPYQTPIAVHLTLHGLAKAKITSHKKYDSGTARERIPLIHTTIHLQPASPTSVDAATSCISYPFAMPVPEKTQSWDELAAVRESSLEYWSWYPSVRLSENNVFATAAGDDLPATLRVGPRGSYIRSEGFIEYKLLATISHVTANEVGGAPTLEPYKHAECGFWMVGAPTEAEVPECKIDRVYWVNYKTYRLDPKIGLYGDLNWKQRSKLTSGMMILDSNAPATIFFSNFFGDSLIEVGKYFHVKVSMDLPGPDFERPAYPAKQVYVEIDPRMVDIESVRVELRQEVRLRAGRFQDRWWNCPWEHTFTTADIAASAASLTPSRSEKGEVIWQMRCGPVPKGLTPTTRTGNISYTYKLNVKVKSRCAGVDRDSEVNLFPICRYAPQRKQNSPPPLPPRIRRKPVGGRTTSSNSTNTERSVPHTPLAEEEDELADLGSYDGNPDEISGAIKAADTLLRGLNYAGKAGRIAHGVVGAIGLF